MRLITLLLLVFSFQSLSAQDFILITGKVVNQAKNEPMPYAHIGIPEKGIGTTTGLDGVFTFKVPIQYSNSTLVVSYIGYEPYKKAISKIESPITIKLKTTSLDLLEVVVMDESRVEDIIRKAVRKIPDNYPSYPTTVLGFYRETRTDELQNYVYLAEGVLNIYKSSYEKIKEGDVSLVQGRQIALVDSFEMERRAGFTSGHLAGNRFDFVKNREDFIDEDYFPSYKYYIEGITSHHDRPVYIIGFDGVEGDRRGRMEGRVYIDTLSYAFLRAEFKIKKSGLKKSNDYPLYAGSWKGNRYVVNYRKVDDQWYFGDALREGLYRDGGVYSNEVMVTQINPERSRPIPYLDRLDRGQRFLDVTGTYDEDFWKHYNTTPLSDKLSESLQQQKNSKKATEVFDSAFMANMQRERDSLARLQAAQTDSSPEALDTSPEKKRSFFRAEGMLSIGAHLISTNGANMSVTYVDKEDRAPIVSASDDMKSRDIEVPIHMHMNFFFHKNFFVRWGYSMEFWNSIYQEMSTGIGAQVNLSKQRPIFVKAIVQHSDFHYARKIGQAKNDYGNFDVKKKTFKADHINLYYGSRSQNLKASLELSVEVNPNLEIFAGATYYLPFARQQNVYFWERKEVFRKKKRLPLNDRLLIEQDGEPFRGSIIDSQNLFFSIGVVAK